LAEAVAGGWAEISGLCYLPLALQTENEERHCQGAALASALWLFWRSFGMKSQAGKDRRRANRHNGQYWNRLRRQFEACAYDHTGAYSESRPHPISPDIHTLQQQMDTNENIMRTENYQKMKANGHFDPEKWLW
jgi:hypothetical protein